MRSYDELYNFRYPHNAYSLDVKNSYKLGENFRIDILAYCLRKGTHTYGPISLNNRSIVYFRLRLIGKEADPVSFPVVKYRMRLSIRKFPKSHCIRQVRHESLHPFRHILLNKINKI